MDFFIPVKPPTVTHQEHKIRVIGGKPVVYEPQELKAARVLLRDHLAGHAPDRPLEGAVRLIVKWCFPLTTGHRNGEYKTTKPDTDNLNKMLKDVMTDLRFWRDDAQVAQEIIEKFWAEIPGIYISVENI